MNAYYSNPKGQTKLRKKKQDALNSQAQASSPLFVECILSKAKQDLEA